MFLPKGVPSVTVANSVVAENLGVLSLASVRARLTVTVL